MKKIFGFILGLSLIFGFTSNSHASLISVLADFPVPNQVIDFSAFGGGFSFTAGPVQVGGPVGEDITWSSTTSNSVIGNGSYGLASNGRWNSGRNGYVGLNTNSGIMRFDFNDAALSAVGGFINYAPGFGTPVISALAGDDSVLETYTLPDILIDTSGFNNGQFFGISRGSEDIHAFALSNAFIVLDDLRFARVDGEPTFPDLPSSSDPVIPEPSTMLLFGAGALGAYVKRRRRS